MNKSRIILLRLIIHVQNAVSNRAVPFAWLSLSWIKPKATAQTVQCFWLMFICDGIAKAMRFFSLG